MDMEFERKLPIPMEVKEMFPIDKKTADTVEKKVALIKKVIAGKDTRKLLIIGPCSADNEDSVIDYIRRLVPIQEKVQDKLIIVPRVYTNKPRTTGEGYKGLVHQPDPGKKPDLFKGIIATRELHMRVVKETGFATADEMLYTENHKYIDDLVAYITVGARSVEDQQHRLTASGLGIAVGMKNPTSGDISVMLNSIQAAQSGHSFIYRGWAVHSNGNPYAHAILRGLNYRNGKHVSNYKYDDLCTISEEYLAKGLSNPSIIIDTNHSNSGKNPFKQPEIILDVLDSAGKNSEIGKMVKGFMVESYIEDGCQNVGEGVYGKSITDPCLGIAKTEAMIYEIADRL